MVLMWDKPAKTMSTAQRNAISADGAPPGVYTPNMSHADMLAWKATLIGGKNPRVEIRKTVTDGGHSAQVLMVVTLTSLRISANGAMHFSLKEECQMIGAIAEARVALEEKIYGGPLDWAV